MNNVLDLQKLKLMDDVLDFGNSGSGIIYNVQKKYEDEICVDVVDKLEENKFFKYATIFFFLSKFLSYKDRKRIISEAYNHLHEEGILYIWDFEKKKGNLINEKINVVLPGGKEKVFQYKNINLLNEMNLSRLKKYINEYFELEEVETYDKIFFIKAKKKGMTHFNESITNSSEL